MNRFFRVFVIVFVVVGFLSCTSSSNSKTTEQLSGSSVWKISKGGNTLFLGGSIHILREEDFPLPKEFDTAFSQSSILVLETDIEKMGDAEVMQYLMMRMFLGEGKTLESLLDRETYLMLEAKCLEFGFPIENVSMFKPSMIMLMLTMLEIQNSGFVQQGVDMHFFERARQENKQLGFLEEIETQINIIVSMGEGYENDFVKYSLQDMYSSTNELTSMVADWRSGSAKYTEETLKLMQESWPILYRDFITNRNIAWLPQIEEYLNSTALAFVIVGLAHLHGPDGLLLKLRNLGYNVEQFK